MAVYSRGHDLVADYLWSKGKISEDAEQELRSLSVSKKTQCLIDFMRLGLTHTDNKFSPSTSRFSFRFLAEIVGNKVVDLETKGSDGAHVPAIYKHILVSHNNRVKENTDSARPKSARASPKKVKKVRKTKTKTSSK